MNCREFCKNHAVYTDNLLSAARMAAMRDHADACDACAHRDVRVRRALMVARNLPSIEVSAGFRSRLESRLSEANSADTRFVASPPSALLRRAVMAAGLVILFAGSILMRTRERGDDQSPVSTPVVASSMDTVPVDDAAALAVAQAGVPVWPAVFMVGQFPTRFANLEFVETEAQR